MPQQESFDTSPVVQDLIDSLDFEDDFDDTKLSYEQALSKIESLEHTLETLQKTFEICEEVMACLDDLPYGQVIINKANNLKKLNYLLNYVLPRRKEALFELDEEKSMPTGIKNSMINRQLKLIKKATNEIHRRSIYDKKVTKFLLSLSSHT